MQELVEMWYPAGQVEEQRPPATLASDPVHAVQEVEPAVLEVPAAQMVQVVPLPM